MTLGTARRRTTATGIDIVDKLVAQGGVPCIPNLRPLTKFVLLRLIDHFNTETGRCDPSVEILARNLGSVPRAITRAISDLRDFGLIAVQYRCGTGHTNQYYPNFEAIQQYNPTYAPIGKCHDANDTSTLTSVSADPDPLVASSPTRESDKQINEQINGTDRGIHLERLPSAGGAGQQISGNQGSRPRKAHIDWQGWIDWLGNQIGRGDATLWIFTAIEKAKEQLEATPEKAARLVDQFLKKMRKTKAPISSIDSEFRTFLENRRS